MPSLIVTITNNLRLKNVPPDILKILTEKLKLKNPKWFARRKEILELDEYMCRNCGNDQNLQVHHKNYINGLKAWQYPDSLLITLCNKCHKQVHGLA